MSNTRDTGHLRNLMVYDASGNITLPANLTVGGVITGYVTSASLSTSLGSYATQTYVNTQVSNLVASAPATLDTLNELAAALGNDVNFATTVATSIGTKQAALSGTGFVKISDTTVSYDNTTYQPLLTNPVTGTGTSNYLPKFTGVSTIGNSSIQEVEGAVQINNGLISGFPEFRYDQGLYARFYITTNVVNNKIGITLGENVTSTTYANIVATIVDKTGANYKGRLEFQVRNGNADFSTPLTLEANGTATFSGDLKVEKTTPLFVLQASASDALHGIEFRQGAGFDAFIKQLPQTGELRLSSGRSVGWGGHLTFYTDTINRLTIASTGAATFSSSVTASSIIKSGGTSSQFLKADGTVDSSGYITSYTETDTLNSVTTRGSSTANNITLSGGGNLFNGHHYFSPYDADGNHYPHYNVGGNNNGSKLNLRMFSGNGSTVKLFSLNGQTGDISWDGSTIIHAGNYSSYAVPTTRSITINGTTYDLSANRSWTVSGSDATKLPLAGGTMTGILAFSNLTGTKIDFYYSGDDRYGIQVQSSELRIHAGAQGASDGGVTFGKSTGTTFTEYLRVRNDGVVVARNDGTGTSWRGRIGHFNATADKSVWFATYDSFAIVGAHNNALTAWADLLVNCVNNEGAGGTVRLAASAFVGTNAIIHAGIIGSQSVSNATTAGGLAVHAARNNEVNKIVRTDANGYIQAGWINTPSGAFTTNITKIYCSDDDYVRYQTPANFVSNLGLITSGNIGSQSVSYATSAGSATTAGSAASSTWATFISSPDGTRNPDTFALPNSTARSVRFDFATSGSIGGTGNYGGVMTYSPWDGTSASTGDSSYQLAFLNETSINGGGVPGLSIRKGIDSSWTTAWYRIITSANVNSYSLPLGGGTMSGPIRRSSHSSTFFEGSYNNIGGNSANSNPIYTIGSAYNPSDSGLGVMYGIGYAHANFWGAGKTLSWGLYIANGGVINVTLGEGSTSIWAQNDIVAYSDVRVKDNIKVIDGALKKVQAIRGVTFTRKDAMPEDRNKRHAGVIAQEVKEVLPEVVTGNDKDMYSVAYGNMVGLLIEAIKEQQAQIEELKTLVYGLTK